MAYVRLDSGAISDGPTFHAECRRALGFPDFYGANMDAWIECMSSLREDDGMVGVRLGADEVLLLEVPDAEALRSRSPDILPGLVECVGLVNRDRYLGAGQPAAIALVFT